MSGGRVVYLSVGDCTVSASPAAIPNDGVTPTYVTVRVVDDRGKPMQGLDASKIVVASTGTGNTITQATGVTNANGQVTASMVTTVAEAKTLSATVLDVAVTDTASVTAEGDAITDPDALRPSDYLPLVFRDFNDKASTDADRGTGSFPSKTGGSEGWDGVEWNDANFLAPIAATDLTWLDGASPYDDGDGNVLQTVFPLGFSGNGQAPVTAQTQGLGAGSRLWVQFSVAFQDTFQVGPANLNKLWFIFPTGAGGGTFLGIRAGYLRFNLQGTPDNGRNDLANNLDNDAAEIITDGRWYTVLMELVATGNNSAGEFRYWVCDHSAMTPEFVQVAEYTDVNYGASSFARVVWSPTWGGQDAGMSVDPEFSYALDVVKVWGY